MREELAGERTKAARAKWMSTQKQVARAVGASPLRCMPHRIRSAHQKHDKLHDDRGTDEMSAIPLAIILDGIALLSFSNSSSISMALSPILTQVGISA